jgi:AraC-like DNA-binding protein
MIYRRVLEAVRYDVDMRYLEGTTKTVTDITFPLGFSGQSPFTRAFKRGSGKPPTAYLLDLVGFLEPSNCDRTRIRATICGKQVART